jgi:hypothetical protein
MTENNRKELIDKLKNHTEADLYLENVLRECKAYDDEKSKQHILAALRNIEEAQPDIVHIDLSRKGFTVNMVLRILNYVSKNLV